MGQLAQVSVLPTPGEFGFRTGTDAGGSLAGRSQQRSAFRPKIELGIRNTVAFGIRITLCAKR
jgi:hypothetical protein